MSELRFSPRANRASEIRWHVWDAAPFDAAAQSGKPILLNLSAVWCHWCHLMDETTFSDPAIITLLNDSLIAIRVDTDRYPHVQDRYIAGGWPTNAFLTPTGEVLWAGTFVDAAEFKRVAAGVIEAWRSRREELESEIERRRRALDAARARPQTLGLVRREAADDIVTALRDNFDPRNGGFGDAPKFPQTDAIELLYALAQEDANLASIADQTLDGMLAGELWDGVEGGFFRYATATDWTAPRYEKLLEVNAVLLDAYANGAWLRCREDWANIAERTVAWADAKLVNRDGLWAGSQAADEEYFRDDAAGRAERTAPPIDRTIYTAANARWIAALATAGARLDRAAWVQRAAHAMLTLLAQLRAPGGGMFHYREGSADPRIDTLLADTLQTARAALALAQATGDFAWLDEARRLARYLEAEFWADDGAFWDRRATENDIGALRYRDRPFEANAEAARFLLDLALVTGERGWRAHAERTLARLGPVAGRYGVAGACFALAVHEFFDAPPRVFIALPPNTHGDDGLRAAAFALRVPGLRVWTVPSGHTVRPQQFTAQERPAAYVWTRRGCAGPTSLAETIVDGL